MGYRVRGAERDVGQIDIERVLVVVELVVGLAEGRRVGRGARALDQHRHRHDHVETVRYRIHPRRTRRLMEFSTVGVEILPVGGPFTQLIVYRSARLFIPFYRRNQAGVTALPA